MQIKFISPPSSNPPSAWHKAVAVVTTFVLGTVALMFSAIALTILAVIAIIGGAYLWWKTREVRRQIQAQMQGFPPSGATMQHDPFRGESFEGEIIEGEAVRVHESNMSIESPAIRRPHQ